MAENNPYDLEVGDIMIDGYSKEKKEYQITSVDTETGIVKFIEVSPGEKEVSMEVLKPKYGWTKKEDNLQVKD